MVPCVAVVHLVPFGGEDELAPQGPWLLCGITCAPLATSGAFVKQVGGRAVFLDNHDYVLNLHDVVILGDGEGYRERNQRQ